MIENVADDAAETTVATTEVTGEKRPDTGPSRAEGIEHDLVESRDINNAIFDDVQRLHQQDRLQAVCNEARSGLVETGRSLAEINVVSPKKAPLPITETGYRSHFLDEELLKKAGGPVRFFLDWIEREATTKALAKAEFKWRQGDLFS